MGSRISHTKQSELINAVLTENCDDVVNIINDTTPNDLAWIMSSPIPEDEYGRTPLHAAIWSDNPNIIAIVLDATTDFEMKDAYGWTPIMTAISRGNLDCVRFLLSKGAKLDVDDPALHEIVIQCIHQGNTEMVDFLLEHGVKVTEKDNQGQNSVINYAVDDQSADMVKLLVNKVGLNVNTKDAYGWAPLHIASGHNNVEICQFLIEKGADVNAKDNDGNTPLAWARKFNAKEVEEELNKHGATAEGEWKGEEPVLSDATENYPTEYTTEGYYEEYPEEIEEANEAISKV